MKAISTAVLTCRPICQLLHRVIASSTVQIETVQVMARTTYHLNTLQLESLGTMSLIEASCVAYSFYTES